MSTIRREVRPRAGNQPRQSLFVVTTFVTKPISVLSLPTTKDERGYKQLYNTRQYHGISKNIEDFHEQDERSLHRSHCVEHYCTCYMYQSDLFVVELCLVPNKCSVKEMEGLIFQSMKRVCSGALLTVVVRTIDRFMLTKI
jgi:hypothetical protein